MTDTNHETPTPSTEACRIAFEQWFEPSGRGLERDHKGGYKFMTAYAAWRAWQAGWEAAVSEAKGLAA